MINSKSLAGVTFMRLRCFAAIFTISLSLSGLTYADTPPNLPNDFSAKTSTVVLPSPSATTGTPAESGNMYENYTYYRERIVQDIAGGTTSVLKLYSKEIQYIYTNLLGQNKCASSVLTGPMTPFFDWVQYSYDAGTGTYNGQTYTAWEYNPQSGPIKSMIVWVAPDNQTPLALFLEGVVTIKITFDTFTPGIPASSYFAVPSICP